MIVFGEKVLTLIIKYHNNKISKNEKSYNKKILGKTIANWTKDALKALNPKTVLLNEQNSLNSVLQKHVYDYDFIAVFYYDTPLITEKNATDSIDYAVLKDLDVCNLPKGFIFKCEFLINEQLTKENKNISESENENVDVDENISENTNVNVNDNVTFNVGVNNKNNNKNKDEKNKNLNNNSNPPNTQSFMHYEQEFLQAYDLANFSKIENTILQKIIQKHKQNGVVFINDKNVIIHHDCKIESETVIYPNNYIFNGSVIEKNCTLMPGNIIRNSQIAKNLKLTYSVITNSKINNSLKPFSVVENNVLIK